MMLLYVIIEGTKRPFACMTHTMLTVAATTQKFEGGHATL